MKQLYCPTCDEIYGEMEEDLAKLAVAGFCHKDHQLTLREKQ